MNHHLITLMVVFPFAGAVLQAFLPGDRNGSLLARWTALVSSLAASLFAFVLIVSMRTQTAELQATEVLPWVGSYAISYEMAVDGLNALMVLLVAILFPILIASEWSRKLGSRGIHAFFLVLQSAFFGVVCAQDLFLLFFFWAMSALPFYFLIGIWGGERRERAAFRSIVAASIGNALFFTALVLIYYSVDPHTFSLRELAGGKLQERTFMFLDRELSVANVAFGLIGAGLALRAPIWPFHGWFTDVAEEAPPSVFVALCAASVPIACYIFIRLSYSLFPGTVSDCATGVVIAGAVNLVMGGICAVTQRGLRLLLAFICLSQVGMILMGVGSLSSAGVVGAVYQQLVLGLGLAGFGLFSGLIIERTGNSKFSPDEQGLGGIAASAPAMALVAGVVVASLLGFPGLGGFVGQALLMIGTYSVHPAVVLLAAVALLLATYYLFTMYRFVFLGKSSRTVQEFPDLTLRERAYLLPLAGFLLVFGIYPKPLLELVRPTVLTLLSVIK